MTGSRGQLWHRWRSLLLLAWWCWGAPAEKSPATRPPRNPRYVLCDSAAEPAAARLGNGELRAFAASVAGEEGPTRKRLGRPRSSLAIRAALLLDEDSKEAWEAVLPQYKEHRPDAGHSADGISYAKCLSEGLPEETEVACRLGPRGGSRRPRPEENDTMWQSFGFGRIVRFRNKELRHDFAHCVLGAGTLRWRRWPGPPRRLYLRLAVRPPGVQVPAVLPLELCRVERPLRQASFCSQPLYGLQRLQREVPWAVEDWLEYHLGHLGIEQGEVYDTDGSLEEALGPERLAQLQHSGRIRYRSFWPQNLSTRLAALSREHPYCTETWAYAHCLATHRALSRWVLLLHAPDEYALSQRRPEARGLLKVLAAYERGLMLDEPVMLMRVRASSFARGGPGGAEESRGRGGVVAASRQRGELRYYHSALVDPSLCICAGPHTCYAEVDSEFPGLVQEVEPEDLVVHHYVEMLERNQGRCRAQHKVCAVPDFSAARLVPLLREL